MIWMLNFIHILHVLYYVKNWKYVKTGVPRYLSSWWNCKFPEFSSSSFPITKFLWIATQTCRTLHTHTYINTYTHAHMILEAVHIFDLCRITKQHGVGRLRKQAAQKEVEFGVRKDIMEEKWQDLSHHLTKCLRLFWELAHKELCRDQPRL